MISWGDVYKVAAAMVPLYVPLLLVFLSVWWWKIFTSEQCESVNVRPVVEDVDAGAV
jgi:auxin efflux carrier family